METLLNLVPIYAELDRLRRIEKAAGDYFSGYCQDEADDLGCCVNLEQHEMAKELRDALANKRSASE